MKSRDPEHLANSALRTKAGLLLSGFFLALILVEASLRCAGWIYGAWRLPRTRAPADGVVRVLCAGDSFTFGVGAPKGQSYPEQLQRLFDARWPGRVSVVNAGVPGANSAAVFSRFREEVDRSRPDVAIVMVGANDDNNFQENNYYLFMPNWRSRLARADAALASLRTYKLLKWALTRRPETEPAAAQRHDPDPRSAEASRAISAAAILSASFKWGEADAVLEKALRGRPDDPALYFEAGQILLHRLGDNARAAEFFRRALELDPRNVTVQILLFMAYQRMGNEEKMNEALAELHRLDPDPLWTNMLRYGVPAQNDLDPFQRVLAYNLGALAEFCRGRGLRAIWMTYPDSRWRNDVIAASARRAGIPLIDNSRLLDGKDQSLYRVPDTHLNAAGYGLMAANVYGRLEPLMSKVLGQHDAAELRP